MNAKNIAKTAQHDLYKAYAKYVNVYNHVSNHPSCVKPSAMRRTVRNQSLQQKLPCLANCFVSQR